MYIQAIKGQLLYETPVQVSRIPHWLVDHYRKPNTKVINAAGADAICINSRLVLIIQQMVHSGPEIGCSVRVVFLQPPDTDMATAVKGALPGRYFSSRLHTSVPFPPFASNTVDLAFTPYTK